MGNVLGSIICALGPILSFGLLQCSGDNKTIVVYVTSAPNVVPTPIPVITAAPAFPVCGGETFQCGTSITYCDPTNNCVCDTSLEGVPFCRGDRFCTELMDCPPEGTSGYPDGTFCVVNTCCASVPKCLPVCNPGNNKNNNDNMLNVVGSMGPKANGI